MNEIKIYLKPSGSTAELYKDFNLYQESYRNVQISIYVPTAILYKNADNTFLNTVKTGAIITAPNGAKVPTVSYNAAYVKTVVYNKIEYAVYTQLMPKEFALYAGTQIIVCNVINIDNADPSTPKIIAVTTSQRAPLVVLESAYLSNDEPLDPTEAEVIEGLINDLQKRLDDGTFAARAIYAWNSEYTYGAGELVFYPDKGEYGVFLKSLTADNKTLPYTDGVLNEEYWQLISDFNILTDLYTLKPDMLAAVAETQAQANAAAQSANNATTQANAAEKSALNAENAAQRIESAAAYLESVQNGETAVPKAISDGNGENIAEHFTEIEELIPSTTTPENQLADKAFVNSSINAMAAFYITYNAEGNAFPTRADLLNATTFYSGGKERIPTQNDYAIVLEDESQPQGVDGSYPTTRYSYQGGSYPDGQWDFQYAVNNTSLTQAQVDAINSGINNTLVAQITTNKNDIATKASTAVATQTSNGLMSAADKTKLDGVGASDVTGVKGNAETKYRVGNVNLTPEDIGAVNKSGDTMTGALQVNAPIIGYNYINNHSAPAFILDKVGSYASGIGASGEADIIKFGAVKAFNEPEWQDDYKQKWSFNGEIIADGGQMTGELTIKDGNQSFNARGYYNNTPTIQYNNSFKSGFYESSWAQDDKCIVSGENNDKFVLQYDYSSGLHVRVSNNGNEVINTIILNQDGELVANNGYKIFQGSYADKYIRFANGIQICWGDQNTKSTINFPSPFANTNYYICTSQSGGTRNTYGNINTENATTSSIYVYQNDGVRCDWIAIGRWY